MYTKLNSKKKFACGLRQAELEHLRSNNIFIYEAIVTCM